MKVIPISAESVKFKSSSTFEKLPGITNANLSFAYNIDTWITIDDGGYPDSEKISVSAIDLAIEGVWDDSSAVNKDFCSRMFKLGDEGNGEIQFTLPNGWIFEGNTVIEGNFTGDATTQVQRFTATCHFKGKPTITMDTTTNP